MAFTDWIIIFATIIANLVCIYFLFKDKELNKIDNEGFAAIEKSTLKFYSVIGLLINIAISVLFIFVYRENSVLFSIKRLCMIAILWSVGLIDLKTYRIPNVFILIGLSLRTIILVCELVFERDLVVDTLISEAIAAIAMTLASFLCTLVVKNSIGYGDIKLFIVMGLFLGMSGLWSAVFVSLFVAFIYAVFLLLTKRKGRKEAIPFAPAIAIGTYISVILTGM